MDEKIFRGVITDFPRYGVMFSAIVTRSFLPLPEGGAASCCHVETKFIAKNEQAATPGGFPARRRSGGSRTCHRLADD